MNSIDLAQVRTALRQQGPSLALGVLFAALGAAAVLWWWMRGRDREAAPAWFGVFAAIYGVRLLLTASLFRLAAGLGRETAEYLVSALTYLILLPLAGFLHGVIPAWRPVLRRCAVGLAVLGAAGIAGDAVFGRPRTLGLLNNVVVLAGITAVLAGVSRRPLAADPTFRSLRIGVLAFLSAAILSNLGSLGLPRLPFDGEALGFAVFLGAVGQMLVRRALANQERLTALDKELEIARRIQLSILPREMPNRGRLALAARYLPMTAVAGDFYDFLIAGEGRIGILVADVSGHGVPAALIASMVKVAIAAQLPHADEPAAVLTGMNDILRGKLQRQFVTAAYLFLDLEAGKMRYAGAGHPPLLWLRPGGAVEEIARNGFVLGMFAKAKYQSVEHAFGTNSLFLLYTDGLIEARRGEEQFGAERLRGVLAASAGMAPDAVADRVMSAVEHWAGPAREDDLTVVVVEVR